jgi:hypothetical protein
MAVEGGMGLSYSLQCLPALRFGCAMSSKH